jgi:hypothetical protein
MLTKSISIDTGVFCPHRYTKLSNLFEVFKTVAVHLNFLVSLSLSMFLLDDNTNQEISTEIFINLYYVAIH